jgi:hypothetical protein
MAIYPSINLSPQNMAVDTSISQSFSFTVSGSPITDYQIKIWDMGVIPNTLVHTSTKVSLSPNKNNGDSVTHTLTAGTIAVNKNYKWQVETWSGATSSVSRQVVFQSFTSPVVSLSVSSPVTTQNLTLTMSYSQAQTIPVNSYTYNLYDSNSILLETSGLIYGFSVVYTFRGLQSGQSYKVKAFGVNQVGMEFTTGLVSFDVSYASVNADIVPSVILNTDTSIVDLNWSQAVRLVGDSTGTISYQSGLVTSSLNSLKVDTSSQVEWIFDIPSTFTCSFIIRLYPEATGDLVQLKDGYVFGYELGKFYVVINGVKIYNTGTIYNDRKYFITLQPHMFKVIEIPPDVIIQSWNEDIMLSELKIEITTVEWGYDMLSNETYDVDGVYGSIGIGAKEEIVV